MYPSPLVPYLDDELIVSDHPGLAHTTVFAGVVENVLRQLAHHHH